MTAQYDRQHWEQLMLAIIERIGVAQFLDHVAYALEQSGEPVLARELAKVVEHMETAK